ncbi:MAG: hypothetical protein J2P25_00645 [Nocardiopsaceae bacterium]|nr:hypothetical protein [Nocardiopsaceae bacterium]
MPDDFVLPPGLRESVEELRCRARELRKRASALGELTLAGATGSDRRSAVRVTLGRDGLPERFDVDSRWRQRVPPAELAAAVDEARTAAMANRGAEWAEALANRDAGPTAADAPAGAVNQARPGAERPDRANPRPREAPVAAEPSRTVSGAEPGGAVSGAEPSRTISELVEAVLSSRGPARGATRDASGGGGRARSGRGTVGRVVIELSGSGMRCEIDPKWAQWRSGMEIGDALNGALRSARAQLAATAADPSTEHAGGADLLTDALAHLRKLLSDT